MRFLIDTANLVQIKEANELGILYGVTTNPALMEKYGLNAASIVEKGRKVIKRKA